MITVVMPSVTHARLLGARLATDTCVDFNVRGEQVTFEGSEGSLLDALTVKEWVFSLSFDDACQHTGAMCYAAV